MKRRTFSDDHHIGEYYDVDEVNAEIAEYKGDREYFRHRDLEQCKEISRLHIKNKASSAEIAKKDKTIISMAKDHILLSQKCVDKDTEIAKLKEALQKVVDDSEIGVVPRSHLDYVQILLSGGI